MIHSIDEWRTKASNQTMQRTPPDLFMSFFAFQPSIGNPPRSQAASAHVLLVRPLAMHRSNFPTMAIVSSRLSLLQLRALLEAPPIRRSVFSVARAGPRKFHVYPCRWHMGREAQRGSTRRQRRASLAPRRRQAHFDLSGRSWLSS